MICSREVQRSTGAAGSVSGTQHLLIPGHLNPELLIWTKRDNHLLADLHRCYILKVLRQS